jgi:hypothetical protein
MEKIKVEVGNNLTGIIIFAMILIWTAIILLA